MADLPDRIETAAPARAMAAPVGFPAKAGLEKVKLAVSRFLKRQPDVKHANVIRLAQAAGQEGWEAEAEVYLPNAMIKTLGLRVRRQVLDRRFYTLRLDNELNVVAYELMDGAGSA